MATKEASGSLTQCAEIVGGAPAGFAVYSGDDALTLPILSIGGVGVVSVSSHLAGKDMKEMHSAFFAGEIAKAAALNIKMLPIVKALFQTTTPSPAPLKAALNMMGLPSGELRLPLVAANEHESSIVREALIQYGLLK